MAHSLALVTDARRGMVLAPRVSSLLRARGVLPEPGEGEPAEEHADRLDTALMALWRDTGEELAFEELYRHARGRVFDWLRWLAGGERGLVDPRDLLQDTFVNVYRYGRGFRDEGPRSFRVWVRTIAGNVLRRWATRGRLRRRGEVSLQELVDQRAEPVDLESGPALRLVEGEDSRALRNAWVLFLAHYARAWSELSERDRQALQLVEVEGRSYAETGAILRVSASNMKMIMLRSRRRLQARMRAAMGAQAPAEEAGGGTAPGRRGEKAPHANVG